MRNHLVSYQDQKILKLKKNFKLFKNKMSKTIFGINTRFKIKNYLDCNSNILLLRTKNSFLINEEVISSRK